jgi:purine-binding chemotaxis protein CheW
MDARTNQLTSDAEQAQAQFLTFVLAGQPYAVPILVVQEIRRYTPATAIPSAPNYVLGVINLRGTVVPVFDLRLRFGTGAGAVDRLTVIIVVAVGTRHVGLVVDDVSKVLTIRPGAMQGPPGLAQHIDTSFILGLVRDGEALVTIIHVDRLIGPDLGNMAA